MISLEKSNLISHQTLKVQFPNFPDHLHQTVQPETGNLLEAPLAPIASQRLKVADGTLVIQDTLGG